MSSVFCSLIACCNRFVSNLAAPMPTTAQKGSAAFLNRLASIEPKLPRHGNPDYRAAFPMLVILPFRRIHALKHQGIL